MVPKLFSPPAQSRRQEIYSRHTKLWLQRQFTLLPWCCGKKPHFHLILLYYFRVPLRPCSKWPVVRCVDSVCRVTASGTVPNHVTAEIIASSGRDSIAVRRTPLSNTVSHLRPLCPRPPRTPPSEYWRTVKACSQRTNSSQNGRVGIRVDN